MTSECTMRASDRDRERTVLVLQDAYVAGRLDLGEFHERTGSAYLAKTWSELCDLTADLPEGLALSRSRFDSIVYYEILDQPPVRRRPFAPILVMATIWLTIAAASHVIMALPLVLLSLFLLWVTCHSLPRQWPRRRPDDENRAD